MVFKEAQYRSSARIVSPLVLRSLCAPVAVPAAGVLTVQKQALFAKDLAMPEAVKNVCGLENKIPDWRPVPEANALSALGAGRRRDAVSMGTTAAVSEGAATARGVSAEGNFDKIALVASVSAGTPGKALAMKITGLMGTGGAWSGPKQIAIEGTLWDNGKVVGSFQAMRYSGGGAFGGYKGTCAILDTCAKELGQDVSKWLTEPSMNALLGDAR